MSEAATDQQIPQTHYAHFLNELQEAGRGSSIQQELASSTTQKPEGIDSDWDRIIDGKLIEWGRDPGQLDEEGTVTPSKQTIQFAIGIACWLRNDGFPAPTRVVPDAYGGILFEANEKNLREMIRLSPDFSLEYSAFEDCRLVQRQKLASPFGSWQQDGATRDNGPASSDSRNEWDKIINNTLVEWERDPSQVEDVGIDAPSAETVHRAILQARHMRDQWLPAPTNIVPDPNGGIVFERNEPEMSEEYHVREDGAVEYMRFEGLKLVERRKI